jgi:hypothetical protein
LGRVIVLGVALALLALGAVLLVAGPPLFRMGVLDLDTARTGLHEIAMYVLAAAGLFALVGLSWALFGKKQRAAIVGVLVVMVAGVAGGSLYAQWVMKGDLPPINDVQTDWGLPVAFTEKALREREKAAAIRVRDDAVVPDGEGKWSGMSYAQAQAAFYIDLQPLKVKQPVPEATLAAAKAAQRLGWDVMLASPPEGMVEAVYHSPWYGLAYDVAVRVTADGAGSRIDVRSTSRDPGHDMGENAAQVKQVIDEISLELR